MNRHTMRRIDLAVALVSDLVAVVALGWLLYQLIVYFARLTGRM